ncbi:MAG: DNA polymerase III delta subunit [Hyphomicrobiaceae bacterium]
MATSKVTDSNAVTLFIGESSIVDPHVKRAIDAQVPVERQSLDVEIIRIPERSLDDAIAALLQVGMFSGSRCVWVRGWPTTQTTGEEAEKKANSGTNRATEATEATDDDSKNQDDGSAELERFLDFIDPEHSAPFLDAQKKKKPIELTNKGIPAGSSLIISTASFDKRKKTSKRLTKVAEVHNLQPATTKDRKLDASSVSDLVRERLAGFGIAKPSSGVIDAILQRAGTEVGQLLQEVDRLCLCAGEGALDVALVEREMRDMASAWVFALTDAISQRDLGEAEAILDSLLSQGEPVQRLVPVIASQVAELIEARRALAHVPSHALDGNSGAFVKKVVPNLPGVWAGRRNPWRVYHLLIAARRFGPRELSRLHGELHRLDLATKGSRIPHRALLSRFLQQACRRPSAPRRTHR